MRACSWFKHVIYCVTVCRFSDIEIKSIMHQLLEVMRHMHSLDIIHRYACCITINMRSTILNTNASLAHEQRH